jgi:hypothetical protein
MRNAPGENKIEQGRGAILTFHFGNSKPNKTGGYEVRMADKARHQRESSPKPGWAKAFDRNPRRNAQVDSDHTVIDILTVTRPMEWIWQSIALHGETIIRYGFDSLVSFRAFVVIISGVLCVIDY